MRVLHRFGLAFAAAASLTSSGVRADSPTDVIPADAKVVVIVNDVEKFTKSTEQFVQGIGLPLPQTDLAQQTQMLGPLGTNWKLNRGFAFVATEPNQDALAGVFPVEDAAASLKQINAEMHGEIGKFDLVGHPV